MNDRGNAEAHGRKERADARYEFRGVHVMLRRLRDAAGLSAAMIPFAIVVHLAAEAAVVGRDGITLGFFARHAYFGLLIAAAVLWFAQTAGLGRSTGERRRRCALLLSGLSGPGRWPGLGALLGANLAFFALTQAVEGMPVASGSLALGLAVALVGSLLSALLVFGLGRSLAAAGLAAVIARSPFRRADTSRFARRIHALGAARCPTAVFSLFVPNRPPPSASLT
jgi:hypothetical protein